MSVCSALRIFDALEPELNSRAAVEGRRLVDLQSRCSFTQVLRTISFCFCWLVVVFSFPDQSAELMTACGTRTFVQDDSSVTTLSTPLPPFCSFSSNPHYSLGFLHPPFHTSFFPFFCFPPDQPCSRCTVPTVLTLQCPGLSCSP